MPEGTAHCWVVGPTCLKASQLVLQHSAPSSPSHGQEPPGTAVHTQARGPVCLGSAPRSAPASWSLPPGTYLTIGTGKGLNQGQEQQTCGTYAAPHPGTLSAALELPQHWPG